MAMGMDIKPHTYVIYEGGEQGDVRVKRLMMEEGNDKTFLDPSRHTKYHMYCSMLFVRYVIV